MKQTFLLITFFFSFGIWNENIQAQNVYIPDAAFLSALITKGVDTNADGEIQQTEADAVTNLNVSGEGIYDMTGIEAFTKLDSLNCSQNYISFLDVMACSNLTYLTCEVNELISLSVAGLTNLTFLDCSYNWGSFGNTGLAELDVSTLSGLHYLLCNNNDIESLDVSGLQNLETLWCYTNKLTSLEVNGCINLYELSCSENLLTNITVAGLANLQGLYCSENLLVNLDVSNLPNLEVVSCDKNQLTSLYTNNCPHLLHLWCQDNTLTNLIISNLQMLSILECENNHLTNLSLSNCPNLYSIWCWGNQLTTLDLTTCTDLDYLRCENNNLNTLLLKNNTSEATLEFQNNPNLQYICQDANQIPFVQQLLAQYGMPNVTVNSVCNSTAIIENENNFTFNLFPSFTDGKITLEAQKPCTLQIYNSLGEKVMETFVAGKEEIDTTPFSEGTYWVKCLNTPQVTLFIKTQ